MNQTLRRPAALAVLALALAAALVAALLSSRGAPAAADPGPTNADTITVTGVGTANGTPDTLTVDFSVHVTRSTVQEALDAEATAVRRVLGALRDSGVPQSRLQTTDLSLDRHYDRHGTPVGYDARETVEARISPLTHAGETISVGATAAGNSVSVGGLRFDIAHDDALVTRARSNAYADARQRAEQYAQLAGRSLGRVIRVSEHVNQPAPQPYYYRDAVQATAGATGSVPVAAGKQGLTVRVEVVWALS